MGVDSAGGWTDNVVVLAVEVVECAVEATVVVGSVGGVCGFCLGFD